MKDQQQGTQKKTYEPPKAKFVPLNLEERLLACTKQTNCGGNGLYWGSCFPQIS